MNITSHQPLVSIIMTSYNYAHFVSFAIQSVLHQTLQDFELIVVDDGSSDNSVEIIKSYTKKHKSKMKVIVHKHNLGIKKSIEDGLHIAKGKYIAFCESDDIFHPECLSTKVLLLEKDEEVKLVFSDIQPLTKTLTNQMRDYLKGVAYFGKNYFTPKGIFDFAYFKFNPIATFTNVVFRKQDIQDFSFNKEFELWCDLQLAIHLSRKGSFAFVPQKLIGWKIHEHSHNARLKKTQHFHHFTENFNKFYQANPHLSAKDIKKLMWLKIIFGLLTPGIVLRKMKRKIFRHL